MLAQLLRGFILNGQILVLADQVVDAGVYRSQRHRHIGRVPNWVALFRNLLPSWVDDQFIACERQKPIELLDMIWKTRNNSSASLPDNVIAEHQLEAAKRGMLKQFVRPAQPDHTCNQDVGV